jgi:hypothetical protein
MTECHQKLFMALLCASQIAVARFERVCRLPTVGDIGVSQ